MEENMRTAILIGLLAIGVEARFLSAQTAPIPPEAAKISRSKSVPIPKYLVYRHFLAWANNLDKKAVGASDAYQFAKPFAHADLENSDLDALRKEARALDSELAEHDGKANAIIAEYRRKAQDAVRQGQGLPAPPAELHDLQTMRTALLVQHMVNLQSALGPEKSAELDAYVGREFVPHLSLKPLARPVARKDSGIPTQPFTLGQQ
jgi:hypothetical protein